MAVDDERRSTVGGRHQGTAPAYELLRAVGNLCAGAGAGACGGTGDEARYDARRMVEVLIAGLRGPSASSR